MTINERLLELRKACKKTQSDFAAVLGLSRTALAEIEAGRNTVLDRHLMMLENWKDYSVNINWLRTGDGEMFLLTESDILEQLRKEYKLDDERFAFICSFIKLSRDEQGIILKFMRSVYEDQEARRARELSIDEKVEAYRQQLEAEKSAAASSELQNGSEKGA